MSGGLVRAGGNVEIALRDVPGIAGKSLITRKVDEPIARAYEKQFGVVVVCDWELYTDVDIAGMAPSWRALALQDRQALADRRAAAKERPVANEATRAGDPSRTREVLRRAWIDMNNLDVTHPNYLTLHADFAKQINSLEEALIADGEMKGPPTVFVPANKTKVKPKALTASEKGLVQATVAAYKNKPVSERMADVKAMTDPNVLRAIMEAEDETDIREMAVQRLFATGATA